MKKSLRHVLAAVLCLCILLSVCVCGAFAESKVLRVGTMPLTVGIPVLYAQQEGYFEEAGLNVDVSIFASGAPINEAIAAGELDVAVSGFASVYSLANANCVWLADVNTTGGIMLFARADDPIASDPEENGLIGSAENLRGKKILGPLGVVAQYMTEAYAAQYGLTPDDIDEVNMDYAAAYQAFVTGEGDLVALNPPYSYTALAEGYVKLCTLESATNVNMVDGCFAPRAVAEARSEEIELFIGCLIKAMDALQDDALRNEFTAKVYADNAIACSAEDLAHEIEDRAYIGTEALTAEGYELGECWVAITDFLVKAEKIDEDNAPNVALSITPSFVSAAVGAEIVGAGN